MIGFGSKGEDRQLEAPLAKLRCVTRSLVASGTAQHRQHVINKSRTSLVEPLADHDREPCHEFAVPDHQGCLSRCRRLHASSRIDRRDRFSFEKERGQSRHITFLSRLLFQSHQHLNLVELTDDFYPLGLNHEPIGRQHVATLSDQQTDS